MIQERTLPSLLIRRRLLAPAGPKPARPRDGTGVVSPPAPAPREPAVRASGRPARCRLPGLARPCPAGLPARRPTAGRVFDCVAVTHRFGSGSTPGGAASAGRTRLPDRGDGASFPGLVASRGAHAPRPRRLHSGSASPKLRRFDLADPARAVALPAGRLPPKPIPPEPSRCRQGGCRRSRSRQSRRAPGRAAAAKADSARAVALPAGPLPPEPIPPEPSRCRGVWCRCHWRRGRCRRRPSCWRHPCSRHCRDRACSRGPAGRSQNLRRSGRAARSRLAQYT